jgi:hypothetical protein
MVRSFVVAVLSFVPAQDMARTGIPGQLEHFIAYAGSKSSRYSDMGGEMLCSHRFILEI